MKKISPEEYWKWDKFEGETSTEDMREDFKRYVKEHYGKNIEFVKSDNPDTFKALFPTVDREEMVLKALEDVRAKVHANILMFRNEHYENKEVATGCDKLIESINDYIDRKIKEISGKDCRDCKKWNDCECGKKGHDKGTSIGYSVGECAEYEVTKDCTSCTHSDEVEGEHCYECVKGLANNFEEVTKNDNRR